jgi:mono/diheme cytochrome c family protein
MKRRTVLFHISFAMILLTGIIAACNKNIHSNTSEAALKADSIAENKYSICPDTFGFGQSVSAAYIQKFDIDVRPDGKGLPVGTGRIHEGQIVYQNKCVLCHGKTGREGGIGGKLVSSPLDSNKVKTIGSYWPYATTVYDYINRAMPYNAPGSLTSQEVYDLTAYLLYANNIIDSTFLITEKTLPLIEMPAKKLFVPDDRVVKK